MSSWRNPFGGNHQNLAQKQDRPTREGYISDDDELGDQVVYNHNHLESLLSLYHRGKQDATEIASSSKTIAGQQHSRSSDYLPSEHEKKTWISVEHTQGFPSSSAPIVSEFGKTQHSISEDEKNVEDEAACTWSNILKEAEALDDNHQENVISCASLTGHPDKTSLQKGVSAKQRFKFSIRPVKPSFYGKGDSSPLDGNSADIPLAQRFERLVGTEISVDNSRQLLMVERLQGLFEENSSSPCSSYKLRGANKRKETRAVNCRKRTLSSSCGRYATANEDILDSFDSDEASGDDEKNGFGAMAVFPMARAQTMTDRFQEVLNAAPETEGNASFFNRHKRPVSGFSDRLQRVLQHEKHQRMQFMKVLHMGEKMHDETKCMDIRILEKSFEAKLTICKCTVEKAFQRAQSIQNSCSTLENRGCSYLTVIFNTRTSDNLEIEVGNVVRIHPPWKEVQVMEHEKIIVCTYLCEMAPL
eukprot:Gb_35582 [translate_table: standard]